MPARRASRIIAAFSARQCMNSRGIVAVARMLGRARDQRARRCRGRARRGSTETPSSAMSPPNARCAAPASSSRVAVHAEQRVDVEVDAVRRTRQWRPAAARMPKRSRTSSASSASRCARNASARALRQPLDRDRRRSLAPHHAFPARVRAADPAVRRAHDRLRAAGQLDHAHVGARAPAASAPVRDRRSPSRAPSGRCGCRSSAARSPPAGRGPSR